jgi:peroxiredoxin
VKVLRVFFVVVLVFALAGCSQDDPTARLKLGDPSPDFKIEDLSGKPVRLSELQGRPVVIRFFIVDCKFCKADTPVFNDYYIKHKDQGLVVLYLTSTVNRKLVERFAEELKIPFQVAIDYGKVVSKLFNVKAEPQTIMLDSDHFIRGAILGGVTEPEFDEILGNEWK